MICWHFLLTKCSLFSWHGLKLPQLVKTLDLNNPKEKILRQNGILHDQRMTHAGFELSILLSGILDCFVETISSISISSHLKKRKQLPRSIIPKCKSGENTVY